MREPLVAIHDAQASLLDQLSGLVQRQRVELMAGNTDALLQMGSEANLLMTRFELLERERRRLVSNHPDAASDAANSRLTTALSALLRESAISGTVMSRFGETLAGAGVTAAPPAEGSSSRYTADGRVIEAESPRSLVAEG